MSQRSAESLGVPKDGESSEESMPARKAGSEASAVIEQLAEATDSAKVGEEQPINSDETAATTTVRFIAFSPEEYQCTVSSGEMPVSIQGADVHMQIPAAEAQQVRLIAVDSNGVPVTETAILQAADEAMQLSEDGSGDRHIITATTAAALLDQQHKDEGNESEDENDGRASKPTLQICAYYSQKDLSSDDSNLPTHMFNTSVASSSTLVPMTMPEEYRNATVMIPAQGMELNDESVNVFQAPPTGKDTEEEGNKIAIIDASMYKRGGPRRAVDKVRNGRKIHQCKECAYYSHQKSKLVRHIRIHTDERPYQCHLCKRAFRNNTTLRNHINTHTGVKPYICGEPDCVMTFGTSGELTRHIKYRHTHEKPFKCTLCDYTSVEISKLRRHFRSHTGERPYSCEDCGKAFANSSVLKRHHMTHTGEKPYECPECNQRFTQRGGVKIHVKEQHFKNAPKFECEICHTLFKRKSDLNVHMLKQHAFQEIPIGCRFCGELFHERWSLMKHQKSHRSYGTRQPQNGREAKKRPWEMDDEEEIEEESTGAKVPMKGKTGKLIPEIDNEAQN